jgi:hypothetical protein
MHVLAPVYFQTVNNVSTAVTFSLTNQAHVFIYACLCKVRSSLFGPCTATRVRLRRGIAQFDAINGLRCASDTGRAGVTELETSELRPDWPNKCTRFTCIITFPRISDQHWLPDPTVIITNNSTEIYGIISFLISETPDLLGLTSAGCHAQVVGEGTDSTDI